MIKCIAIDDEPLALQKLVANSKKIPYLELVAQCQSAIEAQKVIDQQQIDAIFLDINMPDLTGLDFAKSMEKSHSHGPIMVFTTAYSEYAIEGYKANAVGYLLKPYGFDEFETAAQKVKDIAEIRQQAMTDVTTQVDDDGTIFVKSDYKLSRINLDDILYIEGLKDYVRFYLEDGNKIMSLINMKKIEDYLPRPEFLRTHRSYIVHMPKTRLVDRLRIVFGDVLIPISDSYKEDVQQYFDIHTLT